jgi:hypothetical protein
VTQSGDRAVVRNPPVGRFRLSGVRSWLVLVGILAVVAVSGCAPEHACTAIGTPVGVSVTVAAPIAPGVRSAELEVCWSGTCRHPALTLYPGTAAVPDTCPTAPDAPCGARMTSTGTLTGFADVPDLPRTPVTVHLTLTGDTTRDLRTEATPTVSYPNGPDCGEGGPQVAVHVTDTGELRPGP